MLDISPTHGSYIPGNNGTIKGRWSFKIFEEWKRGFKILYTEKTGRNFNHDFPNRNIRSYIYRKLSGYNGDYDFSNGYLDNALVSSELIYFLNKIFDIVTYEGKYVNNNSDSESFFNLLNLELNSLRESIVDFNVDDLLSLGEYFKRILLRSYKALICFSAALKIASISQEARDRILSIL